MIKYEDFVISSEKNTIVECPMKKQPKKSRFNIYKKTCIAEFDKENCCTCDKNTECLVKFNKNQYLVKIPMRDINLEKEGNKESYYLKLYEEANVYIRKGTFSGNKHYLDKAQKLYNKILSTKGCESFSFIGGTYVNLAEARVTENINSSIKGLDIKNGDFKLKIEEDKIAEGYYKKALQIKPTNQYALNGLSIYYFLSNNFNFVFDYFIKIKNAELRERVLGFVTDLSNNLNYYICKNSIDNLKNKERIEFYEKMYKEIKDPYNNKLIGFLLANYYKINGDLLNCYEVAVCEIEKDPNFISYYALISEICTEGYLNRPKELIKYGTKGLEILKRMGSSKHNKEMVITSNIGNAYITLNKYEEAVNLLEEQVKQYPNNTGYYNLARAYYYLGEHNTALDRINKALYFFEDELSFYYLGKIYRELGKIDEAIKYIKKAIYFVENEHLDFLTEKDSCIGSSYVPKETIDEKMKEFYDELILTYISNKDFISAFATNKIALEKWGRLDRFNKYDIVLKNFIDFQKEKEVINTKLIEIENEREIEKNLYKDKINTVRGWVSDLIKIQTNTTENEVDIESEDFWNQYENTMKKVVDKMKNDAENIGADYTSIAGRLKSEYPNLSIKSAACLSTGEFLYQVNKDSFIDFAPIVVEYTKVFEIELNQIFKFSPFKTIGGVIFYLRKINNSKWNSVAECLEILRQIRNGSAHTGLSTLEKVEKIRDIIFKENWLSYILSLNTSNCKN